MGQADADGIGKFEVRCFSEDGVDESCRLSADRLREVDRFVDGRMARNAIEVSHLEEGDAEMLPDVGMDPLGAPVDEPVECAAVAHDAVDEGGQERAVAAREGGGAMAIEGGIDERCFRVHQRPGRDRPDVFHRTDFPRGEKIQNRRIRL